MHLSPIFVISYIDFNLVYFNLEKSYIEKLLSKHQNGISVIYPSIELYIITEMYQINNDYIYFDFILNA